MSSFPPGTRVHAKHNHLTRTAIVVESPSNGDPEAVTVKFVGKTARVTLPAKNVKLAPKHKDVIDLTNDNEVRTATSSAQIRCTTSLHTAISDPYSLGSHRLSAASSSPTHSADGPVPAPFSSDQGRDTLHAQPPNPFSPQGCTPKNIKQSSRDWLLAQHSRHPDPSLTAGQSKLPFNSAQGQPQAVQDPSFLAAQYPPQSRGNPASLRRDTFPKYPTGEERALRAHAGCEENFDHIPKKVHPQSFQFTPIRTDGKMSQTLPPSVPTDPFARGQLPLKSIPSQLGGASIRVSSLPVPLRSEQPTRNPERHPLRSAKAHVLIPRTSIAQDLLRVPRHPQSSFEDDVPIPRNGISRRLLSNSVGHDAADIRGATRLYPTSKRPRIRYDQITDDQMPPSPQMQSNLRKLSRRLAKREREHGRLNVKNRHKSFVVPSLSYQSLLQRGEDRVSIAPGFAPPETFASSEEETSDMETKLMEEIFTELSTKIGDVVLNTDDTLLRNMPSKMSSLSVRGSGRRKNPPKKWSCPHYGTNRARRAPSDIVTSESGVEHGCLEAEVATSPDASPPSGLGERENTKECPIPRLYGCFCQDEFEGHRSPRNDRYSIQCCLCTLWSHMRCIGFGAAEGEALRTRNTKGLERYICAQCVEENLEFGSVTRVLKRPLSDKVFRIGKKWTSSVNAVSAMMLGRSITVTDRLLPSLAEAKSSYGSAWLRKPLAKDEVSARRKNFEELREGVANASVGLRERVLFDEHLGDQRYLPGHLD